MVPDNAEAKPRPTPTAARLQFWELFEMYMMPIWEKLPSGNIVAAVAF